jgi:hypothetical protein
MNREAMMEEMEKRLNAKAVNYSFYIYPTQILKLKEIQRRTNLSISKIIRDAVDDYILSYEEIQEGEEE